MENDISKVSNNLPYLHVCHCDIVCVETCSIVLILCDYRTGLEMSEEE